MVRIAVTHVTGLRCHPCTLLLRNGCSSPAGLGAQVDRNTQSIATVIGPTHACVPRKIAASSAPRSSSDISLGGSFSLLPQTHLAKPRADVSLSSARTPRPELQRLAEKCDWPPTLFSADRFAAFSLSSSKVVGPGRGSRRVASQPRATTTLGSRGTRGREPGVLLATLPLESSAPVTDAGPPQCRRQCLPTAGCAVRHPAPRASRRRALGMRPPTYPAADTPSCSMEVR